MKTIINYILLVGFLSLLSCRDFYDTKSDPIIYGDTYFHIDINTDKAAYKPGEKVVFTLKEIPSANLKVRYSHLGSLVKEETLASKSWSWTTPSDDFKGYMVDVYELVNGKEKVYSSIAVDVSSDWKKFPRYGFLSGYGQISQAMINQNVDVLNRYHINGIQFYDWLHDHQRPLAGTVEQPSATWPDLLGRTNYLTTVKAYIDAAHSKNMKTMFYDLAFGALKNAASDGVKDSWYLFKDATHLEKDNHPLDPPFRSSIYITNPANTEWQAYFAGRIKDVYKVFDFDGYHIDQLGNRGTVYDYNGDIVKLDETYAPFIEAMKENNPNKRLVMNAVSQYGQSKIAKTEVDFLYTEVWDESKTFEQLAGVIQDNNAYANNSKATVLAAYLNYKKSGNTGFVNPAGILLADAVIFSFGGSHLELGEHYLTNEYFPNSNLQMKGEFKKTLASYYDFLVAYQNLLREGNTFTEFSIESVDGKMNLQNWPASQGKIAILGKKMANRDVIQLINFTNANSMEWRDESGTQKEPSPISEAEIKLSVSKTAKNIWMASPDIDGGVAHAIQFTQTGNSITLTVPSIKYWDMLVVEY